MKINSLPLKNLRRKSGRTAALIVIVTLLCISMLGGSLIVDALSGGLNALETRLGADIIVVPDEAKSKKDLESILLDGVPGYFYMNKKYVDKVAARNGIAELSTQYYLASQKAGCCTVPVQIIGFDPKTDFTVTPWIAQSKGKELGQNEIVAGCNVNKTVGGTLEFFGVECTVTARLAPTGTALDNAVYATFETISALVESSKTTSFAYFSKQSPETAVSSILINVADGADIESVVADINIHVKGVEAVATKNMLSGVSDSLQGIRRIISVLIGAVWILALVVLAVVFSSMVNERRKEFALLRIIGLNRKKLAKIVLAENGVIAIAGSIIGIALCAILIYPVSTIIENELNLPFLTPDAASFAAKAALSTALGVAACAAASAHEVVQLTKVDTGLILREANR